MRISVVKTPSNNVKHPELAWPVDRVKDIAVKIGSGVTPKGGAASYVENGVPLLRSQNIHLDGLRLDDVAFIAGEIHAGMSSSHVHEHDVLLNITGASIGRSTFVPSGFGEANVNQHVCIVRPSDRINYKYLNYFFSSPWGQDKIFSSFTGASRQGLSFKELGSIEVPIPSLVEQKRISSYLDASCLAMDGAVTAKRLQIEILEALKTAFVLRAVTEGLEQNVKKTDHKLPNYGPTPLHWKKTKLRYEISVQNGDFVSDKLQDDGEYPVFGGNGIMGRTDKFNVDGETVIIGRVGAYCGNAHYVKGRVWISDNALIVKSRNHGRFLSHLFNVLNFNTQANKTAQPVITGTKIKNTYVVLPPKKEQEAISLFIEDKEAVFAEISDNLKTQIQTLLAYRKSLIHECVTGKRRITEADVAKVQEKASEEWRTKQK